VVLQPGLHPARGGDGNGRPVGHGRPGGGQPAHRRAAGGPADNGLSGPEFAGPGPLVLTEGRQVKRLAVADFPVPAEVLGKIRIPGSFSPRSPQHRRDLAATMRNRLGSADLGGARRPVRAADWERAAPDAALKTGDIADLRRRLRRHPCHDCPDRENHARYAERYMRLARETEALERRVEGRSHVIARTFDRVCRVLERLGYLAGDVVTPDGQRLGRLYTELDLLAAECLRRGLWDDLSPAELAACVSALSFESRQADDAQPPRLPKGRVPEALSATVRTWGELDQLEKDNNLSFLREPDLGFAWAAYRWARGVRLETVLDESPDLTPGDFVRSVKQLIDLLDQIASATPAPLADGTPPPSADRAPPPSADRAPSSSADRAPSSSAGATPAPAAPGASSAPGTSSAPASPGLAATARAAIDAMRRGVVAYSAVTD
jgi:ATP-dependent RNA helicase HelY